MAATEAALNVQPYEVAPGTYVIPQLEEAPPLGFLYLNSMVITGKEPIIVDTGTPVYRETWLKHAWDIVDPADVKWIFLTHDDRDHAGNVMQVLDACPNATLLCTWLMAGRMTEEFPVPFERIRFLNDGESFDAGDRTLTAVRPPIFDNPTTRGLFDDSTGVYWSVDAFASGVPHPAERLDQIPEAGWRADIPFVSQLLAPWTSLVDSGKFRTHLNVVERLPIKVIASCHGPSIHGGQVADVLELMRGIPDLPPVTDFTQAQFEEMMASMVEGAPPGEGAAS